MEVLDGEDEGSIGGQAVEEPAQRPEEPGLG